MSAPRVHPRAWVAWLVAAVLALSVTRNPIDLLLILVCIAAVARTLRGQAKAPSLPLPLLRFGLFIVVTSALFNFATAHFGRTVLFSLPAGIPLLGGPYTLEALVYGAINGLVLVGFLAAFTVLYQALPVHELIRMVPRAFYPIAVVISIAVSFVPTTLVQFQQIREAQMMRGHRVRGLRDWLPLFMPLLVGGLERALQLAEAMTARGFGNVGAREEAKAEVEEEGRMHSGLSLNLNLLLVLGLVALLAGLLMLLVWQRQATGWGLVALGGGVLLAGLWLQGRGIKRTVYRPQPWAGRDWLVVAGAAVVLAAYLVPLPGVSQASLAYSPYPKLSWPPVDPLILAGTLGLLAPAAVLSRRSMRLRLTPGRDSSLQPRLENVVGTNRSE